MKGFSDYQKSPKKCGVFNATVDVSTGSPAEFIHETTLFIDIAIKFEMTMNAAVYLENTSKQILDTCMRVKQVRRRVLAGVAIFNWALLVFCCQKIKALKSC